MLRDARGDEIDDASLPLESDGALCGFARDEVNTSRLVRMHVRDLQDRTRDPRVTELVSLISFHERQRARAFDEAVVTTGETNVSPETCT